MDNVIDLSEEFPTAITAQRRGDNTLILRNIKPFKRLDGKYACYELEHRWCRPGAKDAHSVQGNDFTYWKKNELMWNECLFDQVNLF
jgi:hypothetical protein